MALIEYGSVVSSAKGSFGGIVFSSNMSGPFIRIKSSPIQPQTPAQKAIKGALTDSAKSFRDKLTATEIQEWNTFALTHFLTNRYGEQTRLAGQQWFTRLNSPLHQLHLALMPNPPADLFISAPGALSSTQNTFYPFGPLLNPDVAPPAGIWARVSASALLPISHTRPYSRSAIIASIAPGVTPPWDVTAAWIAKFGHSPAPGIIKFLVNYINAANGVRGHSTSSTCPISTAF